MKDPAYQLSNVFILVLQIATCLFGGLFLWLGIMTFNGQELLNMVMDLAEESHFVTPGEAKAVGMGLIGLFIICIGVFLMLRYLGGVVKKEVLG